MLHSETGAELVAMEDCSVVATVGPWLLMCPEEEKALYSFQAMSISPGPRGGCFLLAQESAA